MGAGGINTLRSAHRRHWLKRGSVALAAGLIAAAGVGCGLTSVSASAFSASLIAHGPTGRGRSSDRFFLNMTFTNPTGAPLTIDVDTPKLLVRSQTIAATIPPPVEVPDEASPSVSMTVILHPPRHQLLPIAAGATVKWTNVEFVLPKADCGSSAEVIVHPLHVRPRVQIQCH